MSEAQQSHIRLTAGLFLLG